MHISHSHSPILHTYSLNKSVLQSTNTHTYLGLEFSKNLKWNTHIDHMTAKAYRSLGFIKRNLYGCTEEIKNLAYCAMVRPTLEYCAAVWDPYTADLINQVEAVQRRAARFVKNNFDRRSSVTTMIESLKWETLSHRRRIIRLSTFQKAYEGHLAIPIQKLLHPVQRFTRKSHSKAFIEVQANKDCLKYSFLPRTVTDWNNLPETITSINDPKSFKRKIIAHYQ